MEKISQRGLWLKEEIARRSNDPQAPLKSMLAELHREAKALKDESLLGFVCFHYADYYYFIQPDQAKFQRYLKLAVQHLLNGDDRTLLGPAYNLFAADAHNGGSYTNALQYYLTALTEGRQWQQHALCAAVGANIGRILMALGNHALAETYLLESMDTLEKSKLRNSRIRYYISICYQRGLNCMFLHKRAEARRCLKELGQALEENEGVISTFRLPYLFLQAWIEAETPKAARLQRIVEELLELMNEEPAPFDYMEDLVYLSEPLLKRGELALVGRLLGAVEESISSCGITHVERQYYELRLKLDRALGETQRETEDMLHLNDCIARLDEEMNRYSLRAIEFSTMMAELRERRRETAQENVLLQKRADTDALTGLPNRYALNDHMDQIFERARAEKKAVGVGFLDVDYFKEYNDTYGHQAGDVCLHALAGALRRLARRRSAFCARYGGDEFVVVLEDAGEEALAEIAATLNEEILSCEIPHKSSRISGVVTVSQGYCFGVPGEKTKVWDYLAGADRALYAAKAARQKPGGAGKVPIQRLPD